jgi:hypothetical protein
MLNCKCNSCGAVLRGSTELAGKTLPCPNCKQPVLVPAIASPSVAVADAPALVQSPRPRFKQRLSWEQIKQFPPDTPLDKIFDTLNPPRIPLEPHEQVKHVLPLLWSLHYALTEKQWHELRERHKKMFPDWEKCECPKRCKADTFDENWEYDHAWHVKIFLNAKFICRGCHWLKSPGARMQTWTNNPKPMTKPPHIIDCLGWTQERVNRLREHDLRRDHGERQSVAQLAQRVQQGTAMALQKPIENLSSDELSKFLGSDQATIAPWSVDLSRISVYGYSKDEITVFEQRMYTVAAKRMQTLG